MRWTILVIVDNGMTAARAISRTPRGERSPSTIRTRQKGISRPISRRRGSITPLYRPTRRLSRKKGYFSTWKAGVPGSPSIRLSNAALFCRCAAVRLPLPQRAVKLVAYARFCDSFHSSYRLNAGRPSCRVPLWLPLSTLWQPAPSAR